MKWLRPLRADPDGLKALRQDYRTTFGTPAGQRVLVDLLRRGHVAQTTWVAGAPDATAFREGRRRLALEVVEMLGGDRDGAIQAVRDDETEKLFP